MATYAAVVETGWHSADYRRYEERQNCGHKHRSVAAAVSCGERLTAAATSGARGPLTPRGMATPSTARTASQSMRTGARGGKWTPKRERPWNTPSGRTSGWPGAYPGVRVEMKQPVVVGNNDKCGRCQARHGGNSHTCPVHGTVSRGCCIPACTPAEWAVETVGNPAMGGYRRIIRLVAGPEPYPGVEG